jgi:tellurite methyltransferase
MSNTSSAPHQDRWGEYYKVALGRPPRELFRQTVIRFGQADHPSRLAIDLGCGAGTETVALLSQGWHVLAIDQQPEAIADVMARVAPEHKARLTTQMVSFEHVEFPASDFIWASLSLPFCPPAHFSRLWEKIVASLRAGGRFAGDFFGVRHTWAKRQAMTFHTVEQIKALCQPLHIEYFITEEGERVTALDGLQLWHAYAVIARKP